MTLIASISGVRGTIGGKPGEGLTPIDIVNFASAYASMLLAQGKKPKVVIGRDARISGEMVSQLVASTLNGMGINVIDLGLSTTPTVEVAVPRLEAGGGIILTASHNPKQWNALKLLNEKGEFISSEEGNELLSMIKNGKFSFADVDHLGSTVSDNTWIDKHIDLILEHDLVDVKAIKKQKYKVAIDCVNSTGGLALPRLLERLGVDEIIELYTEPTGHFPHNPEPLPEHLSDLSAAVRKNDADLGITVDPDVDRLVFVNEDGTFFGEEYTLVAIADYVLQNRKGNTVSNLSSTQALKDVTEKHGGQYTASAVGEVNVVTEMKATNAVIGGEGNGGIIVPELHYGRDALIGTALFLSFMAKTGKRPSQIRAKYPSYFISKNKITLEPGMDVDHILEQVKEKYNKFEINDADGVKIIFDGEWVHLRKSNTEPIIRIYSESSSETTAQNLAQKLMADIRGIIKD
ncbi:MAG: phosphoglucosamine mutase [Bacteroidetes bacterium]|nr:phosphoglucosamine mutase [Bacteroidota bacterium]